MSASSSSGCQALALSKSCAICKAPAAVNNYGAVTCEACKSFFRRANKASAFKNFKCLDGSNCTIDQNNRKSCNYCRWQLCLKAGMNSRRIKSDEQRSFYLARRRTRAPDGRTVVRTTSSGTEQAPQFITLTTTGFLPTVEDLSKFFTQMEIFDLDILWAKYCYSFYNIPITEEARRDKYKNIEQLYDVLLSITKRLVFFINSFSEFAEVNHHDKRILFVGAVSELVVLNGALAYNNDDKMWLSRINRNSKFYYEVPELDAKIVADTLGPELYSDKLKLTVAMQNVRPDEITVMLMFIILLFTPSRPGLIDQVSIQKKQIHFALLLKKYLKWRYGESQGDAVFQELAATLKAFRTTGPGFFEKIHKPMLQVPKYNFMTDIS